MYCRPHTPLLDPESSSGKRKRGQQVNLFSTMKSKKNSKSKRHKNKPEKKCIIVTSEQVQAFKENIAASGQAVFLGATITAVSLFGGGCAATWEIARDTKSPQELTELAKDTDTMVRQIVAHNRNTPADVLRKLAKDEDDWVRGNVAGHPNTPADVLRKLAEDEDGRVRGNVAENPNTPEDIRAKLRTYCSQHCTGCTRSCTGGSCTACTGCTGCTTSLTEPRCWTMIYMPRY